jgi:hypothetical protein
VSVPVGSPLYSSIQMDQRRRLWSTAKSYRLAGFCTASDSGTGSGTPNFAAESS